MMAANCIPAGEVDAQDCFAEFRIETALQDVMPPPRIACVDGDATCDADDVDGQCTFRVAMCFNNTDERLPCVPDPIRSVVLMGRQARSPGARRLLQQIGSLHRTASSSAHEVVFDGFFTEANRCTPFEEFVVRRKRGGGILRAVVARRAAGRDRNRLKLLCLAP